MIRAPVKRLCTLRKLLALAVEFDSAKSLRLETICKYKSLSLAIRQGGLGDHAKLSHSLFTLPHQRHICDLHDGQSSKSTSKSCVKAVMEVHREFTEWAVSRGVKINGIATHEFTGRGLGIVAEKDFKASLLSISVHLVCLKPLPL